MKKSPHEQLKSVLEWMKSQFHRHRKWKHLVAFVDCNSYGSNLLHSRLLVDMNIGTPQGSRLSP